MLRRRILESYGHPQPELANTAQDPYPLDEQLTQIAIPTTLANIVTRTSQYDEIHKRLAQIYRLWRSKSISEYTKIPQWIEVMQRLNNIEQRMIQVTEIDIPIILQEILLIQPMFNLAPCAYQNPSHRPTDKDTFRYVNVAAVTLQHSIQTLPECIKAIIYSYIVFSHAALPFMSNQFIARNEYLMSYVLCLKSSPTISGNSDIPTVKNRKRKLRGETLGRQPVVWQKNWMQVMINQIIPINFEQESTIYQWFIKTTTAAYVTFHITILSCGNFSIKLKSSTGIDTLPLPDLITSQNKCKYDMTKLPSGLFATELRTVVLQGKTSEQVSDQILTFFQQYLTNWEGFCCLPTYLWVLILTDMNNSKDHIMEYAILTKKQIQTFQLIGNNHWISIEVSIDKKQIRIFDSLGNEQLETDKEMRKFLQINYEQSSFIWNDEEWNTIYALNEDSAVQTNEMDCGIYVCLDLYMQFHQLTLDLKNINISQIRHCLLHVFTQNSILPLDTLMKSLVQHSSGLLSQSETGDWRNAALITQIVRPLSNKHIIIKVPPVLMPDRFFRLPLRPTAHQTSSTTLQLLCWQLSIK